MCSIIASFEKEKVKELAKLNEYRGQHSHSVYVFDHLLKPIYSFKDFGPLDLDSHDLPNGYIICHQQAPTTENKDSKNIHPAHRYGHLLWHNGIIKDKEIDRLRYDVLECPDETWDTQLILEKLIRTSTPDNIDGTFSCVWYNGLSLYVFRNEISPLFVNELTDDIILSSTKFECSRPLEPNYLYELKIDEISNGCGSVFKVVGKFFTQENPYYFG